jgi:ribonuclease P protein component
LPKLIILNKRADFKIVQNHGEKWVTKAFVILKHHSPTTPSDSIHFGIIASRKLGGAVVRNRARRRLREIVRALLPEHGQTGAHYVIIARAEALTLPFETLKKDFVWSLNKIHQKPKDKDHALS